MNTNRTMLEIINRRRPLHPRQLTIAQETIRPEDVVRLPRPKIIDKIVIIFFMAYILD